MKIKVSMTDPMITDLEIPVITLVNSNLDSSIKKISIFFRQTILHLVENEEEEYAKIPEKYRDVAMACWGHDDNFSQLFNDQIMGIAENTYYLLDITRIRETCKPIRIALGLDFLSVVTLLRSLGERKLANRYQNAIIKLFSGIFAYCFRITADEKLMEIFRKIRKLGLIELSKFEKQELKSQNPCLKGFYFEEMNKIPFIINFYHEFNTLLEAIEFKGMVYRKKVYNTLLFRLPIPELVEKITSEINGQDAPSSLYSVEWNQRGSIRVSQS